jgi:hypothetical protein
VAEVEHSATAAAAATATATEPAAEVSKTSEAGRQTVESPLCGEGFLFLIFEL